MPSPSPNDGFETAASTHLEGLYALAQVVTSSAKEAVELVDKTFRRAREEGIELTSTDLSAQANQRINLYRILLRMREQRVRPASTPEGVTPRLSDPTTDLSSLKRRWAERYIDSALPPIFASLTTERRVLLMLCEQQGLTCQDAAKILEVDDETACTRLEEARRAVERSLYEDASAFERHLFDAGLPRDWLRSAIHRLVDVELAAVPPTLQPELRTATEERKAARPAPTRAPDDDDRNVALVLKRALVVLVVIAVAGLLGYGFSRLTTRTPDVNLISLSATQAAAVEASFQTTSAEQAERFIRDRLGRRITVPIIDAAALQGISVRDVADGAEAPVILYQSEDGATPIVVYVYSYAFLDSNEDQLQLSNDVLSQIETEGSFDLHDLGEDKALVWRRRDDIYIAITKGDAEELRQRISFPS